MIPQKGAAGEPAAPSNSFTGFLLPGLDADTGVPAECVVRADFTVTMCLPKIGMAAPSAREHLGSLALVPIGIPREYVDDMADASPDLQMATVMDVQAPRADSRSW